MPELDQADFRVRREAVKQLGNAYNPEGVPHLVRMLGDKTASVREEAIRALGKFMEPSTIAAIIQQLKHESEHVRNAASKVIMAFGVRAAPTLLAALKDEDRYVRGGAAVFLGKLRLPEAVEALTALIEDSDPYVLMAVCGALGEYDDKRMIAPLLTVANRDPATIRDEHTYGLGTLNARHAQQGALNKLLLLGQVEAFKRMINDYRGMYSLNNVVRGTAYRATHGDAAAQEMLDWCAEHPDAEVREAYNIATTPK